VEAEHRAEDRGRQVAGEGHQGGGNGGPVKDVTGCHPVTLWTVSETAAYLGYTGPSAASTTRKQLHRWQLTPVSREPGRSGESQYDADQIKALHAARKGRGRHGAARQDGKFAKGTPSGIREEGRTPPCPR
jgi:hypothetical protein